MLSFEVNKDVYIGTLDKQNVNQELKWCVCMCVCAVKSSGEIQGESWSFQPSQEHH